MEKNSKGFEEEFPGFMDSAYAVCAEYEKMNSDEKVSELRTFVEKGPTPALIAIAATMIVCPGEFLKIRESKYA